MASNIKFKRSAVQNRVPTTAQLELGELALNTYDGKLYTEKNSGSASVVEIGSILSSLVVDGDNGGGNGDVTFHGATAGKDLTWDASADSLIASDDTKISFGDSSDLRIYHNTVANTTSPANHLYANSNYIDSHGAGNLFIRTAGTVGTYIGNTDGEHAASFHANGSAVLYWDANERIKTTTDGADISGTGSLKLPVGTTAQRNSSPTAGDMRYNSTTGSFEGYTTGWGELGGSGIGIGSTSTNPGSGVVNPLVGVGFTTINFVGAGLSVTGYGSTVVVDLGSAVSRKYGRKIHAYTATANQTTFTGLSYTNGAAQISVYLNGAKLSAATYTATSGNTVVLGTGASVGDEVEIICIDSGVDLTRNVTSYTATANQTTFTGLGYSDGGDLDVYLNGIRLAQSDYTANNGTSLVLATGASVGDLLEVVDMGQGAQWSSGFGADPDDIYRLNGGVGIGTTNPTDALNITGNVNIVGVITASSFSGIDSDKISEGNTEVETVDTGSNGHVKITTEGTERLRIDSSGRLLHGHDTSLDQNAKIQSFTTGTDTFAGFKYGANAAPNIIRLGKSRHASAGGNTIVADDDEIGRLLFSGNDGSQYRDAAYISGFVDGSPSTGSDMPGRLAFFTSPDGSLPSQERVRITSDGKLLVGHTAAYGSSKTQLFNTAQYVLDLSTWSADANGPTIDFYKSRNATPGSNTIVQSGDVVGKLRFLGMDGSNSRTAAQITAEVDGTPGTNDMPGRLIFSTVPDNSTTVTERIRIDSVGNLSLGKGASASTNYGRNLQIHDTGTSGAALHLTTSDTGSTNSDGYHLVQQGSHVYHWLRESGNIAFATSGNERLRIDSAGNVQLLSTDDGSAAGPEFKFFRNSASPANADYLGQIKFAGESSTGVERNYAKITGKILDVTNGAEDGIIEFSHIKNGSQTITGRFRSDSLQLLNGTSLTVAGTADVTGNTTVGGNLTVSGNFQVDGTTTTVNTATMTVEDKNIEIAKGAANDAAADGAGITVDSGDGDKTWNWVDATNAWTSNQHIQVAAGKVFGFADDTDTYIDRPAANTIKFTAGNAERLTITSNGNVDINGTPPWTVAGGDYRNLSISGQVANSGGFLWLGNGTATTNGDFDLGRINFCNGATITSQIAGSTQTSANDDGRISFWTKVTGGSLTEKFRINSAGKVNITPGGALSGTHPPGDLNIVGTNFLTMTPNDNSNASDNEVLGQISFLPYAAGTIAGASAKIEAIAEATQSGSANPTSLRFYTKPSSTGPGSSGVERLRIAPTGNVSIGGGDPTPSSTGYNKACLHIMQSNSGTSVGCQLKFTINTLGHNANDGGFISYWGDKNFYYNNKENSGLHRFYVTDGSGSSSEKLQIGSDAVYVTGHFEATTKSFIIDHPTKEKYKLRYACLEGPENSVYVRGRTKDGTIDLPDYWTGLVDEDSITVNLTPIGNKRVWVESINNNSVNIASDDDIDCFYTVFAERKDVEKLVVEEEK